MNFVRSLVCGGGIEAFGSQVNLSHILSDEALEKYEGRPVALGFRPEGILLGAQENSYVFEAEVELTELLGDNTNVYVSVGSDSLILKVDPHDTPKLDTKITFSVPYANAYLFDCESEKVIAKK